MKNNVKKFALQIARELEDLHYKTGFETDFDDEILKTIGDTKEDMSSFNKLTKVRIEMWLEYTGFLLEEIDELKNKLLINFADVKNINIKFVEIVSNYDELNKTYEKNFKLVKTFTKVKAVFENAYKLYIQTKSNQKSLLIEGRIKFYGKIFPIYATFLTAFYVTILGVFNFLKKEYLIYLSIIWVFLLILLNFGLLFFLRRGLKEKKEKEA